MAKSIGQQVKTLKIMFPLADASHDVNYVAKVLFSAGTGMFRIVLPEHIGRAMDDPDVWKHTDINRTDYVGWQAPGAGGLIYARTLDVAMEGLKSVFYHYHESLKRSAGVKVIRFAFRANGGSDRRPFGCGQDISFCGLPAVHLSYTVLERVNDKLYERIPDRPFGDRDPLPDRMHYRGTAETSARDAQTIIEWTAEREAFFEATVQKLVALIDAFAEFERLVREDAGAAFAKFAGVAALPAPEPAQEAPSPVRVRTRTRS